MPLNLAEKLLTKKIRSKLLKIRGDKTWHLMHILTAKDLPKRMNYQVDKAVVELINYIEEKSPEVIYTDIKAEDEKIYPIRVYSWSILRSLNAFKFLISLQLKGVIDDLSLPIIIEKKGNALNFINDRIVGDDATVRQHINSPDDLLRKTAGFNLIKKYEFKKIKSRLEKTNSKLFKSYELKNQTDLASHKSPEVIGGAENKINSDNSEKHTYLDSGFDHNLIRKDKYDLTNYLSKIDRKLDAISNNSNNNSDLIQSGYISTEKGRIKSIYLISESILPRDVIFVVFDERFEMPFRFKVKNSTGKETYIKKLHDIAYFVNVPGKRVDYNKRIADNINNGLFRKRRIRDYLKSNRLKKPTLVSKSEDGEILVAKGDVPIRLMKISNVPAQHRYIYIDKTK